MILAAIDAPLLIATAALIGALYGIVSGQQARKDAAAKLAAEQAAEANDDATDRARLGLEDRQWVVETVRQDNDRLRDANSALEAKVSGLQNQLGEVFVRMAELENRDRQRAERELVLVAHVDRCEAELAQLREDPRR